MAGVGGQRTMQADDVAHGEEAVERGLLDAFRQIGRVLAGIGKHIHAEIASDGGHAHSDIAQSDDTDGLARELPQLGVPVAEVGVAAPASLAALAGIVADAVGDVQDVCKRHLGHALGAIGRNIRDHDAPLGCCLHVDNIIARGEHADILQARQLRKHLVGNEHLINKNNIGILGSFHDERCRRAVVDRELAQLLQRFPRQVARVGCIAIELYYFHSLFHCLWFDVGFLGYMCLSCRP